MYCTPVEEGRKERGKKEKKKKEGKGQGGNINRGKRGKLIKKRE